MYIYVSENTFHLAKKDQIVGSYIYDKFNEAIAKVEALLVEPETHCCRYLIINLGGFLKIRGKIIAIPHEICEAEDLGKIKTTWRKESLLAAPSPINIRCLTPNEDELIQDYFHH